MKLTFEVTIELQFPSKRTPEFLSKVYGDLIKNRVVGARSDYPSIGTVEVTPTGVTEN